jgi:hypothetical protein
MRRRVVNVLVLVSAVVCVLSLMLVGRSVFRSDQLAVPIGQNNTFWAATIDGQLVLWHVSGYLLEYFSTSTAEERPDVDNLWKGLTGIRWLGIGWGSPFGWKVVVLPLWVVPIVTAVLPVWWWRVRRRAGGRGFAVKVKGSSPATEDAGDTG